jgi:hypothetical protein
VRTTRPFFQWFFQWKQGVTFALYGWNAGPINGTNIPRSVGAIGRDFLFLLDTQTRPTFVNGLEGANTMPFIH